MSSLPIVKMVQYFPLKSLCTRFVCLQIFTVLLVITNNAYIVRFSAVFQILKVLSYHCYAKYCIYSTRTVVFTVEHSCCSTKTPTEFNGNYPRVTVGYEASAYCLNLSARN